MKKVISLILVLVMTVALFCTPAFAAAYASKSTVHEAEEAEGLIFWDTEGIYDDYNKEDRKIIAYTTEDLANALANAPAEYGVADVKAEDLQPLFCKHFRWSNPAKADDACSFKLDFEGFGSKDEPGAKILMMYRDVTNRGVANTWILVDVSTNGTVNMREVHQGTCAVLVIPQ